MAVGSESRPVRATLLQKVCGNEDMFTLGASVARVVQMASSEDQGTHDLAHYVLSDPALTQRILRLSNTVQYRTASGTAVTTISRAMSLLGFDNVKTTALGMLLVDALSSSAHAGSVKTELEASLLASLAGREMARRAPFGRAEEAAIGALFKNLGPLLIASHEHERYREIGQLMASGKHLPGQASQMILGCTYDALSEAVLTEWKIPEVIVRSTQSLPPGPLKPAGNKSDWMRQVANFSHDVSKLLAKTKNPAGSKEAGALITRYGLALNINEEDLAGIFGAVRDELHTLMKSMDMAVQDVPEEVHDGMPDVLLLATMDAGEPEPDGFHNSGKPLNARELLLAGVQDVTQMRASGQAKVNELILAVLETLYRSMGFRFATVCLKDVRSGQYRARVAFGEKHVERQPHFCFPLAPSRDLFHLSMENDADLMIADATSTKIRDLLPAWHRTLLPDARSFIVLPLVVGKVQLGLFYADRVRPAPEGVPPDETSLIKALKSQVLVALTP